MVKYVIVPADNYPANQPRQKQPQADNVNRMEMRQRFAGCDGPAEESFLGPAAHLQSPAQPHSCIVNMCRNFIMPRTIHHYIRFLSQGFDYLFILIRYVPKYKNLFSA